MLEGCVNRQENCPPSLIICSTSRHEDSAGHKGTIGKYLFTSCLLIADLRLETGGVQWMCAGKGIIHAEMPVHVDGAPDPRGLQLWVDLPKKVRPHHPQVWVTDSSEHTQFKMVVSSSAEFNFTRHPNILPPGPHVSGVRP